MTAALSHERFEVDPTVDSSPTQLSRRRVHTRAMSRVRRLALGLTLALAFTSGLGAALAVQVMQNGGTSALRDRAPRVFVARASSLHVVDGAPEKHPSLSGAADKDRDRDRDREEKPARPARRSKS